MHVLACASSLHVQIPRRFGRREVFFDGASSLCSRDKLSASGSCSNDDLNVSKSVSRSNNINGELGELMWKDIHLMTRRALFSSSAIYTYFHSSRYLSALALGDSSVHG
ncbi:protease Do-like 8, chloroplastic isoform X2 [Asparagus officinalis]|uniref:protease Do-like 8, chloroplastic isoform X2 n=1 Tax=Asparagus officinalis TaxID=4686 RepID=UPI00098E67E7|nr:protease Do-like 8, chloroplastic isoform X2 [Asparagus officinalis]